MANPVAETLHRQAFMMFSIGKNPNKLLRIIVLTTNLIKIALKTNLKIMATITITIIM